MNDAANYVDAIAAGTTAAEITKPPSPTARLHEVTMAALNRQPSPPESAVELTRNAKGDVQVSVTVRGFDSEACESEARAIFDRLCSAYPRADAAPAA